VTNGQLFDTVEVRAGTLRNGGGLGGLPGVSITVDPGATLAVNDQGFAVNALLGNGSVTLGTKTATTLTLQGISTFPGVISGAGQVEISGGETFGGANTYTGGTTIDSSASLVVGGDSSGPGPTGSIVGNIAIGLAGQLNFNRSNSYTFGGVISGAGFVEQSGGGVLTLSGSSTYSGGTEVSSGVLAITNGHALGTSSVTIDDGAELRGIGTLTLGNTVEFGGFSGPAVATISTTGTLTLTSLDGMNSSAAELVFGSTGNAGTVVVNSTSNLPASLDVEIHNGTLRNGGGLGALTGAANSTTVDSGATLALADLSLTVNALQGKGSVTLGSNTATTLTLQGYSVFAGVISGAGQVNISGDMTFTGANTYTGGTTIAPLSSLDLGNGIICSGTSGSLVGNVTVGSDGALIFDRNNNYTFGGVISGEGSVLQVGAGVLTLTGHNTYSGGTLVDFGVLAFSNASVLGTGPIRVQDDGELRATGTTVIDSVVKLGRFDEEIISATAGSTLTINNLNAKEDTVIFGSPGNTGTVLIGSGATTTCTTALVVLNGTLGNAGGLGALTTNSPGILVFPGAKLALNDLSITLSNIATGPGSLVNLGTKATTVLTLTAQADIEGIISGSGSVIVAGQAYFLGANTYTGGTTVAANSSLDLGGQFTAGSVMGNIALSDSTATLLFDRTNAYAFNGVISGPGSVQQIGGGVLTLTNSNTYSGGTEISFGVLAISNANALGTGSVTLDDGVELRAVAPLPGVPNPLPSGAPATVTLNNTVQFASGTNNATLSAAAGRVFVLNSLDTSNTAAVTFGSVGNTGTVVIGPGVTVGSDALSITVADGTLQNGGGLGTLTSGAPVTVNAGARLALNDISTTVLKLAGSGSVNLGTKAATVLTLDHANYAGVISGAGQVSVNGGGVNFQTANTYSGGTTVSQGSLVATNPSGSATGTGPVAINNVGTIGGSGTVSGAMTLNNGGLVEPGVASPTVAGTKFHGSSLLWNAGGALSFQIGSTSDELMLSGALTKGTLGTFEIDLLNSGVQPGTYTLATFASTTFAPTDFTLQLVGVFPLSADNASLSETSHSLLLTIGHSELPTHSDEPSLAGTGAVQADVTTSFVATPAPEPTSAALLTVGLGAFLARRRRRG
jgi:autotransporter-associated beta strand protein